MVSHLNLDSHLQSPKEANYLKTPKYSDTWKIAVIILKFEECGITMYM